MNIVVLGSVNMDLLVQTPRMPGIGETVKGDAIHFMPGGKGANQAVAVARQQIPVSLIGCLGNDDFGRQLMGNMEQERINTDFLTLSHEHATGIASIVVDTCSRNQIIVVPGANQAVAPDQLDRAAHTISRADYLICQLEVNFDAVEKAVDIAFSSGTKVILNPAPAMALPRELLGKVDFLIPNETEATLLTGIQVKDHNSAREAGGRLIQQGVKNILITLGDKGVVGVSRRHGDFYEPAFSVKAVDTTAAGDTFIGYFTVALGLDNSPATAVRKAQAAAALTVQRLGAQSSIPHLKETQEFLQNFGYPS